MKNSVQNFSALNQGGFGIGSEMWVNTMTKPVGEFVANQHLALSAKRTGTQRRTKVNP